MKMLMMVNIPEVHFAFSCNAHSFWTVSFHHFLFAPPPPPPQLPSHVASPLPHTLPPSPISILFTVSPVSKQQQNCQNDSGVSVNTLRIMFIGTNLFFSSHDKACSQCRIFTYSPTSERTFKKQKQKNNIFSN